MLLLGAPGTGKGTQGVRLAERYGARHVSTGDLLRAQVAEGTELGWQVQPFMDRGDLVPDELILATVLEDVLGASSPPSYVLDGFPRTVPQAKAAYEQAVRIGRTLHAVLSLEIATEEITRRLQERARLQGRADDDRETVLHRIREYDEKTLPLMQYYDGRGILLHIDASGEVDDVTRRMLEALDGLPDPDRAALATVLAMTAPLSVDHTAGELTLKTGRAGIGSKVGHDLTLRVREWSGRAVVGDNGEVSSVAVTAALQSLEVVRGDGGVKPLSEKDKATILRNALDSMKATVNPEAVLEAAGISLAAGQTRVTGQLTIAGVTKPQALDLVIQREGAQVRVQVRGEIVQSEFGIKPYSGMLGALKVRDMVELTATLTVTVE